MLPHEPSSIEDIPIGLCERAVRVVLVLSSTILTTNLENLSAKLSYTTFSRAKEGHKVVSSIGSPWRPSKFGASRKRTPRTKKALCFRSTAQKPVSPSTDEVTTPPSTSQSDPQLDDGQQVARYTFLDVCMQEQKHKTWISQIHTVYQHPQQFVEGATR